MERHFSQKKKKVLFTILAVVLTLVAVTTAFLAVRSDYRFLLSQKIAAWGRSAKAEEVTIPTVTLKYEEILNLSGLAVNDSLLLVNDSHLLPEDYKANIVEYNQAELAGQALESYKALSQKVKNTFDTPLYIRSSFRTAEEQEQIYLESASHVAALVGASEHQTGLALDVYVPGYAGSSFIKSKAGRFVNTDCYAYGFIIRYPHGKSDITNIAYEPWHLRYVGIPHAELIMKNSLTLEEYVEDFLVPDTWYEYGGYYICRTKIKDNTLTVPEKFEALTLSPDNTGYIIVTAEKASS